MIWVTAQTSLGTNGLSKIRNAKVGDQTPQKTSGGLVPCSPQFCHTSLPIKRGEML